jgi:hypothetical protein
MVDHDDNDYQILGFLEVAARAPASRDTGYGHLVPSLTFILTWDTYIGQDVIDWATDHNVAIYEMPAYFVPSTNQIGLIGALPLNRQAKEMVDNRLYVVGEFGTAPGDF